MNGLELKTVGEKLRELDYSKKDIKERITVEKDEKEIKSLERQLNYVNGQINGIKMVVELIIQIG